MTMMALGILVLFMFIRSTTIVVGANQTDSDGTDGYIGNNIGTVYTYTFDGNTWNQAMTLDSEDHRNDNQLEQSVAIADGKIIAGAYGNQEWNSTDGFAYIFDAQPISIWGTPEENSPLLTPKPSNIPCAVIQS